MKPIIALSLICLCFSISSTTVAHGTSNTHTKKQSSEQQRFIIQLHDPSVAMKFRQHAATNSIQANTSASKAIQNAKQYAQQLTNQQNALIRELRLALSKIDVIYQYQHSLNAIAVVMHPNEALKIARHPLIKRIDKDKSYKLDTDVGPRLVGAELVWTGAGTQTANGHRGEGVVIGIIDSGINTDHPSFADIAGDGYDHTNPFGAGNFLGDCATEFADLCNDKLIGVYSYPSITDSYADTEVFPPNLPRNGEDYGGHGSHVAATAAGNLLFDVTESLPELDAKESDGVSTGYQFEQISGVAPRANIISYQVCFGGRSDAGDTYADCTGAAIAAGIDSAIQDGVDVINFSISGGGDPWLNPTELAFLSTRNAGIFVATSAGNTGPNASTTDKNAPWYTAVAAAQHGRSFNYQKLLRDFNGGDSSIDAINGRSNTGSITAPIVYAGDFTNPNDLTDPPEQCLQPFPAGTFNGQIVVCDRGEIARVQKAMNVRDGGAGGYVLANVEGGADNLADDPYVVPGIHINAADATILRAWLSTGTNHTATITAKTVENNPAQEDILASFSSRGPNTSISTLTPLLTAPGVNIFAAYADQQFGHDGHQPAASDYEYLDGTSMSSPHVAGAAALIKSAHPDWTPDQIRSALVSTASRTVKLNANNPANWHAGGAGRIQVDKAVDAALLMDETDEAYSTANPDIGGDPRMLNLPAITDNQCLGECVWQRRFTAVRAGDWSIDTESVDNRLSISVTPTSFSLQAGESQSIEVRIDATQAPLNEWSYGLIRLSANGLPEQHLPVSIISSIGNVPEELTILAGRNQDSLLIEDLETVSVENFTTGILGLQVPEQREGLLAVDNTNLDVLDDLEQGVVVFPITLSNDSLYFIAETIASSAPDLDLYFYFDENGDKQIQSDEEIARSTSVDAFEQIRVNEPEAGDYWLLLQNWAGSEADQDSYTLVFSDVKTDTGNNNNLRIIAPDSTSIGTPFDMRLIWDLEDAPDNSRFYGAVTFGTSSNTPDDLTTIPLILSRAQNDVDIIAEDAVLNAGDSHAFNVRVRAGQSPEARDYRLTLTIPEQFELVEGSTNNAQVSGDQVIWEITQLPLPAQDRLLPFELKVKPSADTGQISLSVQSELSNIEGAAPTESGLINEVIINAGPSVNIEDADSLSVLELQSINISAVIVDPSEQGVSIDWQQISGPTLIFASTDTETVVITAPEVETEQRAQLSVTVTDQQGRTDTAEVFLSITNNQAPVITVDAPSSVQTNASYTLSVSVSDPENDEVSVTIDNVETTTVTGTAPATAGSLNFVIVANDGLNTVSQTVTITVNTPPAPPPSRTSSGGGSQLWLSLWLLMFIVWRRHIK